MLIVDNANGARERALKSALKNIILARLCLSPKSAGMNLIEGFNQDKAFVTSSPSAVALFIKLKVFFFQHTSWRGPRLGAAGTGSWTFPPPSGKQVGSDFQEGICSVQREREWS